MNSVIPKQKKIKCKSIQICTTTIEMHTLKKKKTKLGAGNQGHLRCSVYMLITPLKKEKQILKCKENCKKNKQIVNQLYYTKNGCL